MADLTGGYWRTTDDGRHIYIKGGSVEAGLGKQAGKGPLAGHRVNDDGSITTPRGVTIPSKAGPKSVEGPSTAPKEVEANFHKRRDEMLAALADENKITPEQAKANLQKAAEEVVRGSEVWIRAPHTAVSKIVASGGFKSQIETGKSKGTLAPDKRLDFEHRLFGTPKDTAEHPIYGYLEKNADGSSYDNEVASFGNVAFKLKPSVKDRTTFTGEDSLRANGLYLHDKATDGVGTARVLPSLVSKPSGTSIPYGRKVLRSGDNPTLPDEKLNDAALRDVKHGEAVNSYAEAQVHGGVKLNDVAEAVFYDEKHYNAHRAKLAKVGIPSRFIKNPTGPEEL